MSSLHGSSSKGDIHQGRKNEIKQIRQKLTSKFGPGNDRLINGEILSAINSIQKGSGQTTQIDTGNPNSRLSLIQIEDKIKQKLTKRSTISNKIGKVLSIDQPDVRYASIGKQRQLDTLKSPIFSPKVPKHESQLVFQNPVMEALEDRDEPIYNSYHQSPRNSDFDRKKFVATLLESSQRNSKNLTIGRNPYTMKQYQSMSTGEYSNELSMKNGDNISKNRKTIAAKALMTFQEPVKINRHTVMNRFKDQGGKRMHIQPKLQMSQVDNTAIRKNNGLSIVTVSPRGMRSTTNEQVQGQRWAQNTSKMPEEINFQMSPHLHNQMVSDVFDYRKSNVSHTIKSSALPFSFNQNPLNTTQTQGTRFLASVMHEPLQMTAAVGQKHSTIDARRSHTQNKTKYDLEQQTSGQAVGGPIKKPKVSMWDMITLYDTNKKKVEDQAKFVEHKHQQQMLKQFYEEQIEFKRRLKDAECQQKKDDRELMKHNHQKLNTPAYSLNKYQKNSLNEPIKSQSLNRYESTGTPTTRMGSFNNRSHTLNQIDNTTLNLNEKYSIYGPSSSGPNFTQQEIQKDYRIHMLNQQLLEKDVRKTKMYADIKRQRKMTLLNDMVNQNKITKKQQDDAVNNKYVKNDKERKIRGALGRIQKFTAPQVAHMLDQSNKQMATSLQKKRHMLDLQRQMQDKLIRDNKERIYLNQKDLATSGAVLHKINGQIFDAQILNHDEQTKLVQDEKFIEENCKNLNDIKFNQYFLPTNLRSQRFQD